MSRIPITSVGARKLREELRRLKSDLRPRVIQAIADARAHGDLSENAEYHAAREQQGFIEGRIAELEAKLLNAHVIDVSGINAGGKVVFGATVEIMNLETQETAAYQIVGEEEADIKMNLISVWSPIARALIGREAGDAVVVETPSGGIEYEVLEVRYEEQYDAGG